MTKSYKQGFTLIELLVVIAIIGLLASIVLAAVSSARGKGVDAAVKGQLNSARSAGELYASNNSNSYDGVCAALPTATNPGFGGQYAGILGGAASSTGATVATPDSAAPTATTVVCNDTAAGWAIAAPLNGGTSHWCIDSTGAAKAGSTTVITNGTDITCN